MSNPSLKQRSFILLLSVVIASQVDASSLTPAGQLAAGGGPPSDGSCGNSFAGNGKGLRCPDNGCCSQWGWCGSKAEHCALGCQSAFGRCDASPSNGPFSKPHSGPPHGRVDHTRGPGGFRWRGVSKEMHKHKGGRKFGKGKHRGRKGGHSDSGSDSDSDDEHHHHHHHHGMGMGMGMGRRHGRKGGRRHHGHSRHEWSSSDYGHPSSPPFGKSFRRPPFGRPPFRGPHSGPPGHSRKSPFGGPHRGFGHPPRRYGSGMGRYGHRGHRFADRAKDRFKHLRNGRPGKPFNSHGSGDDWRGRRRGFSGVSGPWDRYQAHRSWGDYNNDHEFFPLGGGLFEILKEIIKVPLRDHKGKPPRPPHHPPPHPPTKTNPQIMNRPKPGGVPYGKLIKTCKDPGTVALTFDDGPFRYTNGLLDTLKSNGGIRATFFVNGKNAGDIKDQAMKDVLKRMIADGHQIGSHTFSHKPLSPLSEKDKISEVVKLEDALHRIIGKKPTYMRPPGFECNSACLKLMGKMGYHVIGENLDTQDWKNVSNMQASKDVVSKAVDGADPKKNNFIVLAHDIHEATVAQLAKHMIDKFKEKGYRFVTVGECLGDAPENWYRNK